MCPPWCWTRRSRYTASWAPDCSRPCTRLHWPTFSASAAFASPVSQVPIPVTFEGITFDEGFRADLIVADLVLIELKSLERVASIHKKVVLTYLRLSGLRLGLLINFGAPILKEGYDRVVNGLDEQQTHAERAEHAEMPSRGRAPS